MTEFSECLVEDQLKRHLNLKKTCIARVFCLLCMKKKSTCFLYINVSLYLSYHDILLSANRDQKNVLKCKTKKIRRQKSSNHIFDLYCLFFWLLENVTSF